MGAIAEAIVAYAQPLIDQTDGSIDQMNRALALAQVCWNIAILPDDQQDAAIDELKPALNFGDDEFAEFRQELILPMVQRHREMFPRLHGRSKQTADTVRVVPSPAENRQGAGRNDHCPCGSGLKYKRCCGAPK